MMKTAILLAAALAATGYPLSIVVLRSWRIRFIQHYAFPQRVTRELEKRYPSLSDEQIEQILEGLRQYFIIGVMANRRMVAMPSRAIDMAWHEFILDTRLYRKFCRAAFGRFFHHTPAASMPEADSMRNGMRRAWRLSCQHEGINMKKPTYLPLLFSLDAQLGIADGLSYEYLLHPTQRDTRSQKDGGYSGDSGCGGSSRHSDHGGSGNTGDGGCGGGCGGS